MRRINAIIVTGSWASGKTTFTTILASLLAKRKVPFVFDSDRIRFEEAVLKDVECVTDKGGIGPHSYLTLDTGVPGTRKFIVRDGSIPNSAHEAMIGSIATASLVDPVRLVEYAIGPNIYKFEGEERQPPFLQAGSYLLELLDKYQVTENVIIIELLADVNTRYQRQLVRNDATDFEAFQLFAGEGGSLFPPVQDLNYPLYFPFPNDYTDEARFKKEIEHLFNKLLTHLGL